MKPLQLPWIGRFWENSGQSNRHAEMAFSAAMPPNWFS
jgi:hypothetical protein